MYYIYQHLDGDTVVYVGYGQNDRAFASASKNNRTNEEHLKFMQDKLNAGDPSFVKFVETGLEYQEARKKEREMIEKLQPKFNIEYTEEWRATFKEKQAARNKSQFGMKVKTPLGKFNSIREAANEHGCCNKTLKKRAKSDDFPDYYLIEV